MNKLVNTALYLFLVTAAAPTLAHTGQTMEGMAAGLLHPLLGADHLLVMVAVGAWAALNPGIRARVVLLGFPAFMLAGALAALAGWQVSGVETAIAGSVLFTGLSLLPMRRRASLLAMLLIPLFALSHGYAHGAELPLAAAPALYALGFVSATVVLHAAGYATAAWLTGRGGIAWLRVSGVLTGLFGAWLLLAA